MVKKKIHTTYYKSPLGWIEIRSNGKEVIALEFVAKKRPKADVHASLAPALRQLDEYFGGTRKFFSLKLSLKGTPFQRSVWRRLQKIKFGRTVSYQNIAAAVRRQPAVRAAGGAAGKNKISIVIPCHRVIRSNGGIGGYAGGIWRKRWLLNHESNLIKSH